MEPILVSAVITTFNRYEQLLLAIDSVKSQTYKNVEIIVVNDQSSQREYYQARPEGVKWIDLEKSSREIFGHPAVGYTRNIGIRHAIGDYIAFLDDDDKWLPEKIDIQLKSMLDRGYDFSCSEGFMVTNEFVVGAKYPIYHKEFFENVCKHIFEKYFGSWDGKLPDVFKSELIEKHNFVIQSTVLLKKTLLDKTGLYKEDYPQWNGLESEDWELWRRILNITDCLHIDIPLIYYDGRVKQLRLDQKVKRKLLKAWQHLLR